MSNNVQVKISADVADLTVKMAMARASATELSKAVTQGAKDMLAGDTSPELRARTLAVADAMVQQKAAAAALSREISAIVPSQTRAGVSAGQTKFAIRDLSYQMQDLGVGFSMAAQSSDPFKMAMMTITQQAPQVIQGIQMMRGEAGGFLGFMGGPWGAGLMAAGSILANLAIAHASAGKASDVHNDAEVDLGKSMDALHDKAVRATASIEDGIRASIADAAVKRQQASDTLKAAEAELALARAKAASAGASVSIGAPSYSNMFNTGEQAKQNALMDQAQAEIDQQRTRIDQQTESLRGFQAEIAKIHIEQEFDASAAATARYSQRVSDLAKSYREGKISLDEYERAVRGAKVELKQAEDAAEKKPDARKTRDTSKQEAREADRERAKAARDAETAQREQLQERASVNRQEEMMAEDQARTEIDLSRITLQDKLANLDEEERGGLISKSRAIQQRVDLNDQLAQLDEQLEQRLYQAKLVQLQKDRSNYSKDSKEYRDYTRQIEGLEQQHQNRVSLIKAQADAKRRQQDRILETEGNRRMQGMAGTWAQNLARMATMQQGFSATVRGLWQGIVDVAANVVQEMLQQWITAELIKIGLVKTTGVAAISSKAAEAGAGGTASMAAAPFPINLSAPAFGASMFASTMAYAALSASAEGGWDVPGGAGSGIDGRGGRLSVIHPREMVLPARLADTVRAGVAQSTISAPQMGVAPASLARMMDWVRPDVGKITAQPTLEIPDRRRPTFVDDAAFMFGSAAGQKSRRDAGGSTHLTVQAMDARSFERFAKRNKDGLAKAARSYARNNGR